MKQFTFFKDEPIDDNKKYTNKIDAPVYEPKNKQPYILDLIDDRKAKRLVNEILESNVSKKEKTFLMKSAYRHAVFNYEKIADYYAHASKEMQQLMAKSALVIVDIEDAIKTGYIKLCKDIKKSYLEEYPSEK